jgi:hypothetical protein
VRYKERERQLCESARSFYVSCLLHTSAYVSIRQHTSAYVEERESQLCESTRSFYVSERIQHTTAHVSIRQGSREEIVQVSLVLRVLFVGHVCVCVCTVSVLQYAYMQTEHTCCLSTNTRMHPYASSCVHEGGVSICTFVLVKQENRVPVLVHACF